MKKPTKKPKKPKAPKYDDRHVIAIRFRAESYRDVAALAKSEKLAVSTFLRQAIEKMIDQKRVA
jgi:hypothetical protein